MSFVFVEIIYGMFKCLFIQLKQDLLIKYELYYIIEFIYKLIVYYVNTSSSLFMKTECLK